MTQFDGKGPLGPPDGAPDSLAEAERLFNKQGKEEKPRGMYLPPRDESQSGREPRPGEGPDEGVTYLPVEDNNGKWWGSFFHTVGMIIKSPQKAFALPVPLGGGHPWKFVLSIIATIVAVPLALWLLLIIIGGALSGDLGGFLGMLLVSPLFMILPLAIAFILPLIYLAIGGALNHLFIMLVHRQAGPLRLTYRALGYSAAAILPTIPLYFLALPLSRAHEATDSPTTFILLLALNAVAAIYVFYVQAVALAAAHKCTKARIVLSWVLATVVAWGLLFAFGMGGSIFDNLFS